MSAPYFSSKLLFPKLPNKYKKMPRKNKNCNDKLEILGSYRLKIGILQGKNIIGFLLLIDKFFF